jgi:hypothetical protein
MGGLYEGVQCGFQRPRERKERATEKRVRGGYISKQLYPDPY